MGAGAGSHHVIGLLSQGETMIHEPIRASAFGPELRRLRTAAGLSTHGLGRLIHFSKGHISKVENGLKSPSAQFVRAADAVLAAEGRLSALADTGERTRPGTVHRRAGSASPDPEFAVREDLTPAGPVEEAEVEYSLEAFGGLLRHLRDLGQTLDPSTAVAMVKPPFFALRALTAPLSGPLADEALTLAARFADFAGWMTQETGDDVSALRWVDISAALAREANDDDIIAHTHVRRANIALYQQDAHGTIAFAGLAQEVGRAPRVKGLAALREAQGHALAGSHEEFKACLDRAVALFAGGEPERPHRSPPLGPTKIADPIALAEGWSLHDLGRSAEAVEVLEPLLAATPRTRARAWARTASRLALALAGLREVDRACDLTGDILTLPLVARSATIRSDLRQLSRTLNRWSSDPVVRRTVPRLSAALLPMSDRRPTPSAPLPGEER
ncbi:helix-turn-helix transcriptional regulator [Saccharothrix xinjiangensis]|uniref:Helix-turn-helix domain-containing protein n=1 Tax=Saccharothrix xinjiangensis TaxID=204798 RepID=A0ABV9XVN3_9PSEU